MIESIDALLSPHDPAVLENAFRSSERLHLKTDRAPEFERLVSWTTFNTLLTAESAWEGRLRLVRLGSDVPLDMVTEKDDDDRSKRRINTVNLQNLCRQGLSVVLNHVETAIPRVAALNAMLERRLRAKVWTNCYASFGRDGALKAHWDAHDVLILQVHGRKRWWCYGRPERAPTKPQSFPALKDVEPAEWDIVLEPGDVLFLPRGEIHRAEVQGEHSFHLTLGIRASRVGTFVEWLAEKIEQDALGRADIDALGSAEDRRTQARAMRDLLSNELATIDLDAFLAEKDALRSHYPALGLGLATDLKPHYWLSPALRRRVPLPETGPAKFGGGRFTLTDPERAVLAALLNRDTLRLETVMETLSTYAPNDVRDAVAGLSRRSLIFIFED